MRFIPR